MKWALKLEAYARGARASCRRSIPVGQNWPRKKNGVEQQLSIVRAGGRKVFWEKDLSVATADIKKNPGISARWPNLCVESRLYAGEAGYWPTSQRRTPRGFPVCQGRRRRVGSFHFSLEPRTRAARAIMRSMNSNVSNHGIQNAQASAMLIVRNDADRPQSPKPGALYGKPRTGWRLRTALRHWATVTRWMTTRVTGGACFAVAEQRSGRHEAMCRLAAR